ncbi:MAG TPA: hypothetical protein VN719_09405 [Gemmatimonadales bacterium]|nr:hypothetical protein [Gemmatimonadales bacterium]
MFTALYQWVAGVVVSRLINKTLTGVPAAIAAHVNVSALALVAFKAWQTGGGVVAVEQALLSQVAAYVPASDVTLVASGLVFTFEIERRFGLPAPTAGVNVTP